MNPWWCDDAAGDAGLLNEVSAERRGLAAAKVRGQTWRSLVFGTRREPMPSFQGPVEGPCEGRTGICCSGGGIRSAAYNLGALQSLQAAEELEKANYLAAVSGGAYIAAAFSMVAKPWPRDRSRPEPGQPGADDSDPAALAVVPPFAPRSPEEQYLRNRSSYLAPGGMEKLFLGFRIVMGLLFNVILLSLPLFALGILGGELVYGPFLPDLAHSADVPLGFWLTPLVALGLALVLGVLGMIFRSHTEHQRQLLQTWATRLLVGAAGAALLLIAVPKLVHLFHHSDAVESGTGTPASKGVAGGLTGFAGLAAAILAYLQQALRSPKRVVADAGRARKFVGGLGARVKTLLVYLVGAIVGPLLFLGVFVFAVAFDLGDGRPLGMGPVAWGVEAGVLFLALYLAADITSWSLHPFYKRRLCTAFALKRVRTQDLTESELARAQPAPPAPRGEDAGCALERDYQNLVRLSETALQGEEMPTLVVCAAANVSDPGAVPPGREVTSFTFSAHTVGGPLLGGAPTTEMETAFGGLRRSSDLSLPAAVAVSGAALSPSMGKMTRKPFRFLLALANIRLGVWLPNPRRVMTTEKKWRHLFSRPRPLHLLMELLGRNGVDSKYVYVTDGGHYENLGLVELLRRGCTRIYCFDASGGESFGELGDAIALARSELGVQIAIDPSKLRPDKETDVAHADTVEGRFTYEDGTEGTLLYARNVLTAAASADVHAYHELDPSFPHNPTVDQLYTDRKFEGYRRLGELAARNAVKRMRALHPDPADHGGNGAKPAGEDLVTQSIELPRGELRLLQPREAAELPDDGPVEWAPVAPYWAVLWRSGVALARELEGLPLEGRRVVELGCGLAAPSIAAARAGATVLATDASDEALELLARNAEANGVRIQTACVDWADPNGLLELGPFDLVLAADVLYERASVAKLLSLLPHLAPESWIADPGRPAAAAFVEQASGRWQVDTRVRDVVRLYRVRVG